MQQSDPAPSTPAPGGARPRHPGARPAGLRLTTRGRLLLLAFALALLLVVPGIALGGDPGRTRPTFDYVTQPGDTLWGLARRLEPGHDPRPLVDQLIQVNHVHGPLRAGQRLRLPAPLAPATTTPAG
ncbi:MAG TPA: LysM peptidoglycan-binding domain-containing protein [Actinomycetes bacterium]|nr:LysM peptidoglycan-binding domain-containing protein [Actinomycetes bacterium]